MNKGKILSFIEKDFLTLANLERSMRFMLNSPSRQNQHKILRAAFRRTCDIMLRRRKYIAKELGLKLEMLQDPE